MTETQATASAAEAETPGKPGEQTAEPTAVAGSKGVAESAAGKAEETPETPAEDSGGRSAVGRATVPNAEKTSTTGVKYTRPPGMPPPPDKPAAASPQGPGGGTAPSSTGVIPAVARASVRTAPGLAPLSLSGAGGVPGGAQATQPTGSVIGSGRVTEAVRAARATVSAAAGRGPRRARLHLKRIDPWSVMKFSFAVSFVLFVVVIVATSVLYLALDAMGVFGSVNKALVDMIGATGGDTTSVKVTAKGIIGGAAMVGLVNVVLFTALSTLGAFIYNVCADLVGGIELTLAEKD